ncbi:MAG: GntR family transcriptional regulator [Clostridiales bacterium]|nr:GntR family transcriptional regulator [Clostridiales bacterium]
MSSSLASSIYEKLLKKILNNEIPAGEFINRREIAEQMNVSVAPVMEAMILLENDGLLETMPRKGTRVSLVCNEDISGYLVVREALECTAARMICGEKIADAMDDLIPLARAVDASPHRSMTYFRKDYEFHTSLVRLSGCEILEKEHERITKLGLFYNTNKLVSPNDAATRYSHVELLNQLKEADPDKAYSIMRSHIISGKGSLVITR